MLQSVALCVETLYGDPFLIRDLGKQAQGKYLSSLTSFSQKKLKMESRRHERTQISVSHFFEGNKDKFNMKVSDQTRSQDPHRVHH